MEAEVGQQCLLAARHRTRKNRHDSSRQGAEGHQLRCEPYRYNYLLHNPVIPYDDRDFHIYTP